jgi:hypothetical protein
MLDYSESPVLINPCLPNRPCDPLLVRIWTKSPQPGALTNLVDGGHLISISGSWITLLSYDEIGEPTYCLPPQAFRRIAICDLTTTTKQELRNRERRYVCRKDIHNQASARKMKNGR